MLAIAAGSFSSHGWEKCLDANNHICDIACHGVSILSWEGLVFEMSALRSEDAGGSAVSHMLARFVARKQISGAVSLLARRGQIVHLEATGLSDLQSGRRLQTNDLFWVASMTKPIVAAALLILMDERRVKLSDPVKNYLPEFADLWIAVGGGQEQSSALVRPRCLITIGDLLRHTHGLADISASHCEATLAEHVQAIARKPLLYEPGSRWEYGNAGFNTIGRVVEVLSDDSFQNFLQSRFFEPLDMKDTTFFPRETHRERLAKMYGPNADRSALEEMPLVMLPGNLWSSKRTVFPGGGLFSTASDMARFYQMLANGGIFEGRRYLSEEAVHGMTRRQTGDLKTAADGFGYGLGVHVVERPAGEFAQISPGSWGHDGASGTSAFYDARRKLLMIHLIQRTGLWGTPSEGGAMRQAFQEAALSMVTGEAGRLGAPALPLTPEASSP